MEDERELEDPCFYAYLDISLENQCKELCDYMQSLGADIPDSSGVLDDDLTHIIESCHFCFQENKELEMEAALNSITSLLVCMDMNRGESLVKKFCKKLTREQSKKLEISCLKVLYLLYQGLQTQSTPRYEVYCELIPLAGRTGQIMSVFTDTPTLKKSFPRVTIDKLQHLYRLIHEALLKCKESEKAAKVIMELLGTYTPENASQAKEDAQRCIVSALADPNTFLLDPLLALPPVKVLEGAPIHELLTIFVTDPLPTYLTFYNENKEFVDSLGLSHEENVRKMRLLTFMQMAEAKEELTFDEVQDQLQISEKDVHQFIIDVLKTKLVKARVNDKQKKILVSATMHRTFGKMQWAHLRGTLGSWETHLKNLSNGLTAVVKLQADIMNKAGLEGSLAPPMVL
ncbi:eukaryotic translation initiation factor 3 subunit M-like [Artemia franciscana]|uniref:eukaryotic translation initiation factor 3 subunit M-like n=1 Tax=Artemia franciscana TaxID=6661 RepID=UPI0032DB8091